MKHDRLAVLFLVVGVLTAAVVAAGGPIVWAILLMGLPFVALFVILGGIAHGHVDNGHFRRPDKP